MAAALVAGGLHVAVVRYRSLTDLVADRDRLRAWPWLLAVTAAILGVLAVAALAGQLLDAGGSHGLLASALAVLAYAARVFAYVVGWVGAGCSTHPRLAGRARARASARVEAAAASAGRQQAAS